MKKEKVGLIIAVIIITVVLFFGGFLAVMTIKNERVTAIQDERIESLQGIMAVQVDKVKGLSTLLVVEEPYIPYELVGNDYLVLSQYHRILGEDRQKYYEDLKVEFIDLETLSSKKVYEPAELVAQTLKAEFAFTSDAYVTGEQENLAVSLVNLESQENLVATFSKEFDEVSFAKEPELTTEPIDKIYYPLLDGDFLEKQGLDYEFMLWSLGENKLKISFKGSHLPEKNKQLYRMFPLLKDYQGIYQQNFELTLKETFSFEQLLALFKEEKASVFTPYEMANYAAIDKKAHQINDLADYQKWANIYKEMDRVVE